MNNVFRASLSIVLTSREVGWAERGRLLLTSSFMPYVCEREI